MRIALIGFMGAGKSTVGRLLSESFDCPFVEIDEGVVSISGLSTVTDIFAELGEERFRDLESETIQNLHIPGHVVIATGGGLVERAAHIEKLKSLGCRIVFLYASFDEISKRLVGDTTRPLWKDGGSDALELYRKRNPLYRSYADLIIDTDEMSAEGASRTITKLLIGKPRYAVG